MKRAEQLRELSREHNAVLVLARTARRAASEGDPLEVRACWEQLAENFDAEIRSHFATEERLIIPLLARVGEAWLAGRLLREHRAIRRAIEDRSRWSRARLVAVADVLRTHVRREERQAFPLVERHADAATLKALLADHAST